MRSGPLDWQGAQRQTLAPEPGKLCLGAGTRHPASARVPAWSSVPDPAPILGKVPWYRTEVAGRGAGLRWHAEVPGCGGWPRCHGAGTRRRTGAPAWCRARAPAWCRARAPAWCRIVAPDQANGPDQANEPDQANGPDRVNEPDRANDLDQADAPDRAHDLVQADASDQVPARCRPVGPAPPPCTGRAARAERRMTGPLGSTARPPPGRAARHPHHGGAFWPRNRSRSSCSRGSSVRVRRRC